MHLPIALLTSCRELFLEGVGRLRQAFVERLLDSPPVVNGTIVQVVAIIVDDDENEFEEAWRVPLWSNTNKRISKYIYRIPTGDYRKCSPATGESNERFLCRRRESRKSAEARLLEVLNSTASCAAICDSYMTILSKSFLESSNVPFVNIHPGITAMSDPARLIGPTPTRDAYTRARFGYVLVDDKNKRFWPEGEVVLVNWDQGPRRAVLVPQVCTTGVTAHMMTADIDSGRVLAFQKYNFDPNTESEETLRTRNYELKCAVFSTAVETLMKEGFLRTTLSRTFT